MTKVLCDRCGKEIEPYERTSYPYLSITTQETCELNSRALDLCPHCKAQFYEWLYPTVAKSEEKLDINATDWR